MKMEKNSNFFDEHPCIATSIVGAIFTVIFCVSPLRAVTGFIFIVVGAFSGVFLTYMLIINIIAFVAVLNEKIKIGIVLSILGGFLGGILALTFEQFESKAIRIVLTACVWFSICVATSGYLFLENDFRLFP
ncbi:MAG: hypothetical protein ACI4KG_01540 [Oscillospiraceae bacterium]